MLTLGLALACSVAFTLPASGQADAVPDHLTQFYEYAESLQTEGEDGWALFGQITESHRAIVQTYIDYEHHAGPVRYELLWDPAALDYLESEALVEAEYGRIETLLEEVRAARIPEQLVALTTKSRLTLPRRDGDLQTLPMPFLGAARSLARCNCARLVKAFEAGDEIEARAAFDANIWIARALLRAAPGRSNGAALDIEEWTLARLRQAIRQGEPSPSLAEALLDTLDRTPRPTLNQLWYADRLLFLDTVNRLYTDDGGGDGRLVLERVGRFYQAEPLGSAPATGVASDEFATKAQVLALERELRAADERVARALPRERPALVRAIEERRAEGLQVRITEDVNLLSYLVPSRYLAADWYDRHTLSLNGTRVMLAIEVSRGREGRVPEALAELVPDVLAEMPVDPYTQRPLVYRTDSSSAVGYVLYSCGFDGVDDGGTSHEQRDASALRQNAGGCDYVFVGDGTE